jgi:hypothetical protein
MAASSPTCELDFLAASARSEGFEARVLLSAPQPGEKNGHLDFA